MGLREKVVQLVKDWPALPGLIAVLLVFAGLAAIGGDRPQSQPVSSPSGEGTGAEQVPADAAGVGRPAGSAGSMAAGAGSFVAEGVVDVDSGSAASATGTTADESVAPLPDPPEIPEPPDAGPLPELPVDPVGTVEDAVATALLVAENPWLLESILCSAPLAPFGVAGLVLGLGGVAPPVPLDDVADTLYTFVQLCEDTLPL